MVDPRPNELGFRTLHNIRLRNQEQELSLKPARRKSALEILFPGEETFMRHLLILNEVNTMEVKEYSGFAHKLYQAYHAPFLQHLTLLVQPARIKSRTLTLILVSKMIRHLVDVKRAELRLSESDMFQPETTFALSTTANSQE